MEIDRDLESGPGTKQGLAATIFSSGFDAVSAVWRHHREHGIRFALGQRKQIRMEQTVLYF